ncbi:MAG TPA: protein kinase [Kofleriaceae bacterium]
MQDLVAKSLKLVGRVLGDKFKLTACIGIGGSGAVYKADQMALGRTVAVKILNEELSADTRMIARFRGEAMSASRLNHPNCVSIIDYGQAPDGLLYLAMEYVKGPTLTQLLVNENPLAVDRVLDIIAQTLYGIEEAHLAGVVHADLKADNIILDQRRAGVDTVKIVDFGIARLVTGLTTREQNEDRSISGTPEYMAPEVISGAPPSFASDIYAVGIILYELLVERTPFFASSTTEILTNHLKVQPQLLTSRRDNVPREVDQVIAKALAKHPSDRYASAADMRESVVTIRARLRHLPSTDKCISCGSSCQPGWKFCPECGTPRLQIQKTIEIPPVFQSEIVLPLPFTGRADELHTLVEHLKRPAGPRSGLLIVGHEGAGRSTLLRHAYDQIANETRLVYQVGPDPSGLAGPYYPIRSLLAAVLSLPAAATFDDLRAATLGLGLNDRDVPGIAQLFGHPTTLLELEPPVRRREMVWSALRALERAGTMHPAAIVCEDVDRFDHPSLEILRRATEVTDLSLPPIVMTATAAFAAQWPSSLARLEVGALDAKDLDAIITAIAPRVRGLPAPQQLFETTRAYPGHVDHVVRYLLEGGKAEDTKVSLPDLIAARLSMLQRETREILQTAAVLGIEPPLDVLRAMVGGAEALDSAIHDAELHGLLARDAGGQLAFSSRLVREIVYDATPADVRRSLHSQAAEACAKLSSDVGSLGHHHDLAGHARDAVDLLRKAGDHAAAQLDDAGASQFFYRALMAVRAAVLSGDINDGADSQFVTLSVKLADVLRARGETALARGILAEARGWSSAPKFSAMIDRASAAISLSEGDVEGAIGGLRRGVGRAIGTGDMNLVCELYLDLSSALLRAGDAAAANRELAECIDLATLGEGFSTLDGPESFWRILRAQAQIVDAEGDSYRALRLAEAALFHAQRVRSRLGAARVQQLLATLCDTVGLGNKAERYRQSALTEMRNLGDRRATAELLLTDVPHPGAVVMPNRLQDAMALTKEIGWTEGHDRAKRKSDPPSSTG